VPGGVGVIEATMAALFSSLGVPKEISFVAVMGFRLISFWLITFVGLALSPFLNRKKALQPDEISAN
jgi:hypothetical protein